MATLLLDEPALHKNGHLNGHANHSREQQSRINGAKSRGPKTEEGKAKSSQNARKHGLTAKLFLVDPTDEQAFKEFKFCLIGGLAPSNPVQMLLVDNIAQVAWKLRQADNIETDLLRDNLEQGETLHHAFTFDSPKVLAISTYQARLDRRLHKLLDQFHKMKKHAQEFGAANNWLENFGRQIAEEKQRRGFTKNESSRGGDAAPLIEPDLRISRIRLTRGPLT